VGFRPQGLSRTTLRFGSTVGEKTQDAVSAPVRITPRTTCLIREKSTRTPFTAASCPIDAETPHLIVTGNKQMYLRFYGKPANLSLGRTHNDFVKVCIDIVVQ
jgi:hypothetical protein